MEHWRAVDLLKDHVICPSFGLEKMQFDAEVFSKSRLTK